MVYTYNQGVQKEKRSKIPAIIGALLIVMLGISLIAFQRTFASSSPEVVYDALASVSPTTNYPSQPFQAQQTSEFGDYVHLAGTARKLDTVSVTMSNWAKQATPANVAFCEANSSNCNDSGYFWPITVNIYANTLSADDTPTTLLGSKTVLTFVPWRPASDPSCASTSNGTGWKTDDTCFNYSGIAFNASFDLSSLGLTLPNDVIVGFVYNTQTYGPNPTGIDGPYNSLNIAVPENNTAVVGEDDDSDATFWNTSTLGYYSNPSCTGGTFCLDTNWGVYGTVPIKITATKAMPTSKDQCKNNGWKNYNGAFKNQGDCVSSIVSVGRNK